ALADETQRPPIILYRLDRDLSEGEIIAARRRFWIIESIDMLVINLAAALAVSSGIEREHRIAGVQQGLPRLPAIDVIAFPVPVFFGARPTVQQQHQRPGLMALLGELQIARHQKTLGSPKHNFLTLSAVLLGLLHYAPFQRNGSVVIEKGQPRLECLLADARVRRGLGAAPG